MPLSRGLTPGHLLGSPTWHSDHRLWPVGHISTDHRIGWPSVNLSTEEGVSTPIYTREMGLTRHKGVLQLVGAEPGFNPSLAHGPPLLIRDAMPASVGISANGERGGRKPLRQRRRKAGPRSHTGCHRAWVNRGMSSGKLRLL